MGALMGVQASQAKNRMAGGEGFMDWLRGRHEAYTDMWHNAVVGVTNRGQMLVDDRLPRQQVASIVAKRIVNDPTLTAESALGQALRQRLEKTGMSASDIQGLEGHIYGGKETVKNIGDAVHWLVANKETATNADVMDLYEAAQNAGPRRVLMMGSETSGQQARRTMVESLAGPQAAYLVPLTGAGLALYGGYAATRPEEANEPMDVNRAR